MTLEQFFQENPLVALGFSGGVDSSYLFYAGRYYGARVKAYFVKTPFQPEFELRDARRLAEQIGAEITVLESEILDDRQVAQNPPNRCYYCKSIIFSALKKQAAYEDIPILIDGTNASDDAVDRPGMRALAELSVRSPLRECGITKSEVRRLSKAAGLFTWDKPSYACLATRIPSGKAITKELLQNIERAEDALFLLGFTDFRVRVLENAARLQFSEGQMDMAFSKKAEVIKSIKPYFPAVLLDLEGR